MGRASTPHQEPAVLPALSKSHTATVIHAVTPRTWRETAASLGPAATAFAQATGFDGSPGSHCLAPAPDGAIAAVLFGLDPLGGDPLALGKLPPLLPAGTYRLAGFPGDHDLAALAFLLGGYRFERYRRKPSAQALELVVPEGVDILRLQRIAEGVALGRDLINTPANDLGPAELEDETRRIAGLFGAKIRSYVGDKLLLQNFPMVHAVGRASSRPPRLIDLTWGDPGHPKVTLVGKGVVFDTGGLNIKPESGMLLMKKDMGGAATALAAGWMIMAAGLKLRLRILIPAVENAISGSAFRPGDVLASRKGLSVEIGNTDAEGRLILADALALADEEAPELLFDFATLTGAARVALGPDLPPLFTDDDALASECETIGRHVADPVWRLPLWRPYEAMLDSKIADLNHIGSSPFAGAVTAALFLRRFVEKAHAYAHVDIFGWTPTPKPGRPQGGEPQAARLVYTLLEARYG
jgi:leucyl aminopeptidase